MSPARRLAHLRYASAQPRTRETLCHRLPEEEMDAATVTWMRADATRAKAKDLMDQGANEEAAKVFQESVELFDEFVRLTSQGLSAASGGGGRWPR